MFRFLLLASATALAGCTISTGGGNDSDDNSAASIRLGNGQVSVSGPGFSGNFQGPSLLPSADDFDMNGVHLYPGSAITGLKIAGKPDAGEGEKSDGKVSVSFTSPASAATVRDWLKERLDKAGFTLSVAGNGLTGKTDEGHPFALKLSDDGAGKSKGVIDMGG